MSHLNINGVDKPLDHIRLNNVRSENLFDKNTAVIGERVLQNSVSAEEKAAHSDYIDVTGISVLTVNKKYSATNFYFYADKTTTSIAYVNDFTANVPAEAKYCRINILKDDLDTIMLNIGSTALPYQSYYITKEAWEARTRVILHGLTDPLCGIDTYKDTLDLSTGPLIRYIKKLVLTGEENVQKFDISTGTLFRVSIPRPRLSDTLGDHCFCTHYRPVVSPRPVGTISGASSTTGSVDIVDNFASIEAFKSYLAAQYAAGTPVTVWYVLAEPETEQITLPSNLTGIVEGYLTQDGTPSPTSPVYPTANGTLEQGGTYSLDTGAYAIAWGRADTFTGTSSISVRGYGLPVKSWEIDGNSQQTGTPTPDNPIMPEFVGVRTGNLFDISTVTLGKYINAQGAETDSTAQTPVQALNHTDYIEIQPNTDYTYHYKFRYGVANTIALCWFDASKSLISRNTKDIYAAYKEYTLTGTSPANAAFCIINFTGYLPNESMELSFNSGSTALPYEPHGYKLTIISANQTVPIYLGQVQTLRRVKKLVLTGDEGWQTANDRMYLDLLPDDYVRASGIVTCICTHYRAQEQVSSSSRVNEGCITLGTNPNNQRLYIYDTDITTANNFKSYLAAQYAAGTPVTVWYVLATPEIGIVNEPLAKIGDYADTLTSEQAGVTIQTIDGNNTISVDTSLAPSRFEIKVHAKAITP